MITTNRENKRKFLIRKLFNELKKELIIYNPRNVKIKFRINTKCNFNASNSSSVRYYGNAVTKKVEMCSVKLNLYSLKRRFLKNNNSRYDCYYNGRVNFLNKYILHNRKNALKFVLLHELAHCKLTIHNKWHIKSIKAKNEALADRIAIRHLSKDKKPIQKNKQKICKYCNTAKNINDFRVYKGIRVLNICKVCELKKARERKLNVL